MNRIFTTAFIAVAFVLSAGNIHAAIYRAVTSGNFTNGATWLGGSAPPAMLGANDIIVDGGVTVTLDANLVVSSFFSLVQLQGTGTIQSTGNHYIVLSGGGITGDVTSMIDVDSIYIGNVNYGFLGSVIAKKVNFGGAQIPSTANITADELMYFTSGLTNFQGGATIVLGSGTPRPTIVIQGGSFNLGGGVNLDLTVPYDLRYQQPSVPIGSGPELSGSGLTDIGIAVGTGNLVTLDNDLTVTGKLKLISGSLALTMGNFKLIMDGNSSFDPAGAGSIYGSPNAEIIITSTATDLGTIRFLPTAQEVKNLDLKAASPNAELKLGSPLTISGQLNLQSGLFNIQDKTLSIQGGLGSITGGSSGSYIVTEANGQLKQDIAPGSSATYPVGNNSAYAPCAITNLKSTTLVGMMVNVLQGVKENGTSGNDMAATKPVVDATWTTSIQGSAAADYGLELSWSAGMEVNSFDRNRSYVAQYASGKWPNANGTAAGTAGSMYTSKKDSIKTGGTFSVFDANTLSVSPVKTAKQLSIYPNPAKDELHVIVNEAVSAILFNTTGQAVLHTELAKGSNRIAVAQLPTGMYYLQLRGNSEVNTTSFIKD